MSRVLYDTAAALQHAHLSLGLRGQEQFIVPYARHSSRSLGPPCGAQPACGGGADGVPHLAPLNGGASATLQWEYFWTGRW